MSDETCCRDDDSTPKRFSISVIAITLIALYPLSVGPVVKMCFALGFKPNDGLMRVVRIFYYPLEWLTHEVHWINSFFKWYMTLFI